MLPTPEEDNVDLEFTIFARLKAGDPEAWIRLHDRVAAEIKRLAKKKLTGLLHKVDEDDLSQTTFRTILRRVREDQYEDASESDIARIIVCLGVKKCRQKIRHHRAEKRDADKEVSLNTSTDDREFQELVDPDGWGTASVQELIESALSRVDAGQRDQFLAILEDRACGYTLEEIAVRTGIPFGTVKRRHSVLPKLFPNIE